MRAARQSFRDSISPWEVPSLLIAVVARPLPAPLLGHLCSNSTQPAANSGERGLIFANLQSDYVEIRRNLCRLRRVYRRNVLGVPPIQVGMEKRLLNCNYTGRGSYTGWLAKILRV
jgi:hypothetical protein